MAILDEWVTGIDKIDHPPDPPPVTHVSRLHFVEDDGIWIACLCGWERRLGFGETLDYTNKVWHEHQPPVTRRMVEYTEPAVDEWEREPAIHEVINEATEHQPPDLSEKVEAVADVLRKWSSSTKLPETRRYMAERIVARLYGKNAT